MKNSAFLLVFLLLAGIGCAAQTHAQTGNRKPKGKTVQAYCLMKDGNMLVVDKGV